MKIQCLNIEKGENVHKHWCHLCGGKQHIPFVSALKYYLGGLCVLNDEGNADSSDEEMEKRIVSGIATFMMKYNYTGNIGYELVKMGEPLSTLRETTKTIKEYYGKNV